MIPPEHEFMLRLSRIPGIERAVSRYTGDPVPDFSGRSVDEVFDYLDGQFMRGKWTADKLFACLAEVSR